MKLTRESVRAWRRYEIENRRSQVEYERHPIVSKGRSGLHTCLCCRILTEQSAVCLSCLRLCPDWREVVGDRDLVAEIRRADRTSGWGRINARDTG